MSLFKNLTTEGHEETQDRLGGFSRLETDLYAGKIKFAYAGASAAGAKNVTIIAQLANGQEYRETVYITNRKGENFWINDEKKKVSLPGFSMVDDLCQVTTDRPLADQNTEEKIVNVWDPETRKEQPKSVPVLVDLTGQDILVAIQKSTVNKTKKEGDQYVVTDETTEENNIEKVFHPTFRCTVVEAKKAAADGKAPEAAFIDAWVERNKGKTRDKTQGKTAQGGQSGRPGQSSGPPQAGQAGGQRKSLFSSAA